MTNKYISIGIGIIIIVGVASLAFYSKNLKVRVEPEGGRAEPEDSLVALVSQHNSRESCWTIINGNIYDLTSWIPKHPGGEEAILLLCGRDGSEEFNQQHGGAPLQEKILAGFKIETSDE